MSPEPVPCVAFLLVREGRVLVERRRADKALEPGALGSVFKMDASRDGPSCVIQQGSGRRAMRDIVQGR